LLEADVISVRSASNPSLHDTSQPATEGVHLLQVEGCIEALEVVTAGTGRDGTASAVPISACIAGSGGGR